MDIKGYKIMPELLPHTPFTIGIKADEKVTCKLALMPFKKFSELKGIYFGQQTFSENQNITLRVPPNVAMPQNMLDILNYSHYEQISEFLDEPEDVVNNYQEKQGEYWNKIGRPHKSLPKFHPFLNVKFFLPAISFSNNKQPKHHFPERLPQFPFSKYKIGQYDQGYGHGACINSTVYAVILQH